MIVGYSLSIIDSTSGISPKEVLMNRHMKENGIFKTSLENNSALTHKPFLGVNFSMPSCIGAVIRCLMIGVRVPLFLLVIEVLPQCLPWQWPLMEGTLCVVTVYGS